MVRCTKAPKRNVLSASYRRSRRRSENPEGRRYTWCG